MVLAKGREERRAEESEVAVGLRMRPVLDHLSRDLSSVEVDCGDERDNSGIAQNGTPTTAGRDFLWEPLVGIDDGDRAVTVVSEGARERASVRDDRRPPIGGGKHLSHSTRHGERGVAEGDYLGAFDVEA